MSDEEKKAMERAEFLIKIDTYLEKEMLTNLLNLIEKQQKELEKLKENNGYHIGFIDGGIAKRYEYEDKIKAKIEEIQDGTYDAKIILQKLLEE